MSRSGGALCVVSSRDPRVNAIPTIAPGISFTADWRPWVRSSYIIRWLSLARRTLSKRPRTRYDWHYRPPARVDYADTGDDGKRSGNWLDLCRSERGVFATLRLLRANWHQSITRKLHVGTNERHQLSTDRSCHTVEFTLNVSCLSS